MNFFLLYVSLPALFFAIMAKTPFEELQQSALRDRDHAGDCGVRSFCRSAPVNSWAG